MIALVAVAAFVALGVPDGAHGVAWPSVRVSFDLPLGAFGLFSVALAGGYVVASALCGAATRRVGVDAVLITSLALGTTALLGLAAAPNWRVALLAGTVLGFAGGGVDAGVQIHATQRHGLRMMGSLHAGYSVGTIIGPLVVTAVLAAGLSWRSGYLLISALQATLLLAVVATRSGWDAPAPSIAAVVPPANPATRVVTGLMAFFTAVGLEAAASIWAYSFLIGARGLAPTPAGVVVAAFFAAQTTPRLLIAAIGHRITARRVLAISCALALGGGSVLLVRNPAITVLALLITGLGIGGMFPSLMSSTPQRVGHARLATTVGYQVAAASAGATLMIGLTGVVLDRAGLQTFPVIVLALAALMAGFAALAERAPVRASLP